MSVESSGSVNGGGHSGGSHNHNKGYQTDTLNPYFLHPNENPGLVLVTPPLSGPNYHSWSHYLSHTQCNESKLCSFSLPPTENTNSEYSFSVYCSGLGRMEMKISLSLSSITEFWSFASQHQKSLWCITFKCIWPWLSLASCMVWCFYQMRFLMVFDMASHLPFNMNGFKFFTNGGGLGKPDFKDILERVTNIYNQFTEEGSLTLSKRVASLPTKTVDYMTVYTSDYIQDCIQEDYYNGNGNSVLIAYREGDDDDDGGYDYAPAA
ncbi:phosphoglucosamine mutase family protein [Trifolium repens]|nr:phosphoglucosamine mutase family protein [Trifolium repens]